MQGRLANALFAWFGTDPQVIRHVLPSDVETWGKIRRLNGGDTMHAAELVERDMTFIRVCPSRSAPTDRS